MSKKRLLPPQCFESDHDYYAQFEDDDEIENDDFDDDDYDNNLIYDDFAPWNYQGGY